MERISPTVGIYKGRNILMKYHILAFGAGFLLDQLFGDPYFLPHPIRGIGCEQAIHRAIRPRERGRSADRENFWW